MRKKQSFVIFIVAVLLIFANICVLMKNSHGVSTEQVNEFTTTNDHQKDGTKCMENITQTHTSENMADEKLTYEILDKATSDKMNCFKIPNRAGFIKCNGHLFSIYYKELGDRIRQMEVRDDDIWVSTFPKSGTAWTQEMVWCVANDANLEAAKQRLQKRFPYLEFSSLSDFKKIAENPKVKMSAFALDSVNYVNELPSPRFIKTHLPFDLLPKKLQNNSTRAKIIYTIRNPRDACVSYYYHCRRTEGFKGNLESFAQLYMEGHVPYGPYFKHIKGYWRRRNDANILFLKYEDMKTDMKSVLQKTANFIGKRISDDNIETLLDHLSFSSMKQNRAVNYAAITEKNNKENTYMRKGEIGEWKKEMNYDLYQRFEKWEKENWNESSFNLFTYE